MKWLSALLIIIAISCSLPNYKNNTSKTESPKQNDKPIIVLISIDGYRHDYTKIYNPPYLSQILQDGVSAELKPVFPSYTFPNHYSIVTGLYVENHGIIHNSFYDPARRDEYSLRNRKAVSNPQWYLGEPIWVTAEKQGIKTGCHYWVGCEAKIRGVFPTYHLDYDHNKPSVERVRTVLEWLQKDESERPQFISLYYSVVDSKGHKYGPLSPQVGEAISDVDASIELLVSESKKIAKNINFIILSDHGMEDLRKKEVVYLEDFADKELEKFQIIGAGPIVQIYNRFNGDEKALYKKLKKQRKYFYTYNSKNTPTKYHYKKSHRAADILLVTKNDYFIQKSRNEINFLAKRVASHGYDPYKMKSMNGIFYATGPLFKKALKISAFENIHIQPFLAHLLKLKNHKVDGKLSVLKKILAKKEK